MGRSRLCLEWRKSSRVSCSCRNPDHRLHISPDLERRDSHCASPNSQAKERSIGFLLRNMRWRLDARDGILHPNLVPKRQGRVGRRVRYPHHRAGALDSREQHFRRRDYLQDRLLHAVHDPVVRRHLRRRGLDHDFQSRQRKGRLDRLPGRVRLRGGPWHAAAQHGRADRPIAEGRADRLLAGFLRAVARRRCLRLRRAEHLYEQAEGLSDAYSGHPCWRGYGGWSDEYQACRAAGAAAAGLDSV